MAGDRRKSSPEETPPGTDGVSSPHRTPKRKASEPLSPSRKRPNVGESRFGGAARTAVSPEREPPPQVHKTPTTVCPESAINPYYWQYANSTPSRNHPPISDAQYLENRISNDKALPAVNSTLDSIVTQYLKHQHRLCPAPITTLPPLSLHYQHICPEPRRPLDAPANTSARLLARQWSPRFGGMGGRRQEKHLVYSR